MNNRIIIKKWLKSNKRTYAWLAERCAVAQGTVKNWMSSKPIPASKLKLINALIRETEPITITAILENSMQQPYTIALDSTDYAIVKKAAGATGESIGKWTQRVLTEEAHGILKRNRDRNNQPCVSSL